MENNNVDEESLLYKTISIIAVCLMLFIELMTLILGFGIFVAIITIILSLIFGLSVSEGFFDIVMVSIIVLFIPIKFIIKTYFKNTYSTFKIEIEILIERITDKLGFIEENIIPKVYCDIDYLFHHNLYQNLEHIMDKFLTVVKFILGGIFIIQVIRCLFTLYLITNAFIYAKADLSSGTNSYNALSILGWILFVQIFWAFIWIILFSVVKSFNKKRITIDDILEHVDD